MIRSLFHRMRSRAVSDYEKQILEALEPSGPPGPLLDCGCDDGRWTIKLGERLGSRKLYGIEVVETRRQEAVARGIDARTGDLNGIFPFDDNSMAVAHANQVIEHLANTDQFISEIRRVLMPGGYAVICTENLASWHNIFALLLGWQPFSLTNISATRRQLGNPLAIHHGETQDQPLSWQHLRVFAYRGLCQVFQEHGFTVEKVTGAGYFPFPGFLARLDSRHAAFLTLKVRKPG